MESMKAFTEGIKESIVGRAVWLLVNYC